MGSSALKETDWYKDGVQKFMDAGIPEIVVEIDLSRLFPKKFEIGPYGGCVETQLAYFSLEHSIGFEWSDTKKALQVCGDLMDSLIGGDYEIEKIGPPGITLRKVSE